MKRIILAIALLATTGLCGTGPAISGQAPSAANDPDIPISHHDRIYAAEQFSNTVSVTDPADNKLLGVIRLGEPQPNNLSPLYRGQVLVHGLGFSPDHRTLAVVSIGTNSVTFITTATNTIKHTTYVGRAPHEAFFTPDGKEVWVTVRGEDYVAVLDGNTFEEKTRIKVPNGPGMQIFSPDGKYGYVCSSFTPETVVISVADHAIVGRVPQTSPFCPNIAASPDGMQVWLTLKDVGKTEVFIAKPPFTLLKTLDTGPITNHVNFASNANGRFAYVTVGGTNEVKVFRTDTFEQVATIPVGALPHGVWPSGDGTRIYVGLENADELAVLDTLANKVVASVPIGQAPQAWSMSRTRCRRGAARRTCSRWTWLAERHSFRLRARRRWLGNGRRRQPSPCSIRDYSGAAGVRYGAGAPPPLYPGAGRQAQRAKARCIPWRASRPIRRALPLSTRWGPFGRSCKETCPEDARYLVISEMAGGEPGAVVQVAGGMRGRSIKAMRAGTAGGRHSAPARRQIGRRGTR